jgi:hypothetical protein
MAIAMNANAALLPQERAMRQVLYRNEAATRRRQRFPGLARGMT